ncbi:hypothetical protein L6164_008986 [Bauhinia variegata]|uniref:Uncharacterized protein n=1 Tax=Bauhinia variegata TaxID=167791 RepID=A0ACB9PHA7_BAUVA|nr:hypothetical protein L6164_008986 [Bauhinia variegata]
MEDDTLDNLKYPGVTVEECTKMIGESLKTPMVKFLREHLEKAGCPVRDDFFKATNCTTAASGGYTPGLGITFCSNVLRFQDEVNQVMIHELIHAFDECHAKVDWSNCAHHACSEIRANHLSGDCHFKRELLRGHMKLRGHEQDCVRRRVMKSMAVNPDCSQAASKEAMEAVWDICYNDTKPFDRAP